MPAAAWFVVWASGRMELSQRRTVVRGVAKFVLFTSLLLLVITIPSGSIDISDLWLFTGFALFPALLLLAILKARRIQRAWVRAMATGVSGALFALTSLFFVVICGLEVFATRSNVYSPDGGHVALIRVHSQGAVGIDEGSVFLRRTWRPLGVTVWTGIVHYNFDDRGSNSPQVKWLDNSRLQIRYYADPSNTRLPGYPVVCGGINQTVEIVCNNEFRAQYYPSLQGPAVHHGNHDDGLQRLE